MTIRDPCANVGSRRLTLPVLDTHSVGGLGWRHRSSLRVRSLGPSRRNQRVPLSPCPQKGTTGGIAGVEHKRVPLSPCHQQGTSGYEETRGQVERNVNGDVVGPPFGCTSK
jgi:hypothetical protein